MEVKRILLVLCLCILLESTVSKKVKSKPEIEDVYGDLNDDEDGNLQNDDEEDDDAAEYDNAEGKENIGEEQVEFITKPQTFVGKIGDTIRMPCAITNPDIVNTWRKDEALIYQGHINVAPEKYPNVKELDINNTLEVNITRDLDYGNYACILIVDNNVESRPRIVHRLMHPMPPVISGIFTENNKTVYSIGDTLTLRCVASGIPKPVISWHKGSERLEFQGENITIPILSEYNEGTYRCLADNYVTEPSHHHISIHVKHAPKITTGQYIVTSNKEKDTELVCSVNAYPEAEPVWRKGNEIVGNGGNRKIKIKRKGQTVESILLISNLNEDDFTNYTCTAENSLGKSEKVINLVKIPAVREFIKPEKSYKDVVLSWKVESKSPIEAHEIQYRKKGDLAWRTALPEVTNSENDIYTVKYLLKDLDVGSYETRLRSKNEHGWSEFSEIMPFEGVLAKPGSSTHKNQHKKHHKEKELKEKHIIQEATSAPQQQEIVQKEAPVGESKPPGGSSANISASATILSIALIFIFYIRQ